MYVHGGGMLVKTCANVFCRPSASTGTTRVLVIAMAVIDALVWVSIACNAYTFRRHSLSKRSP